MVILRNFILASLSLFFLTQCTTTPNGNSGTPVLSVAADTRTISILPGKWECSMMWRSAELVLQENGTFTYHGQECYGQPFSQGQWTNDKGVVQLTSFDDFKPRVQKDTVSIGEDWEKGKRKFKKGEIVYAGPRNIPPTVLRGPNDTVRIYLDNVQLRLRKDTLLCIGPEPFFGDQIFIRNMHVR